MKSINFQDKKTLTIFILSFVLGLLLIALATFAILAYTNSLQNQAAENTANNNTPEAVEPVSFKVAVSGDFAYNLNSSATLAGMGQSNADFMLALGDFSYGEAPAPSEQNWCALVRDRVGPNVPFELVIGNHDDGTPGSTQFSEYEKCLPSKVEGLVGQYGTQNYFDYKGIARFINIAPNIRVYGHEYTQGNEHYTWLESAIDGAREAGMNWVIVSMHKNCITMGEKPCEIGQDLQDLLVAKKVDLVLQGHEHGYMRTKQLALNEGTCKNILVDGFNDNCVIGSGAQFNKGDGTITAIVGTGGKEIRDVHLDDTEAGYFDAWDGANIGNSYGFLDMLVSEHYLEATFVKTSGAGEFSDSFIIE